MPATFSYSSPFDLVDGHTHTYYLNIPAGTWADSGSLQIGGVGFASTPGGTVPVITMHWLSGSPFYVANTPNTILTGFNGGLTFTVSTPGHTQSAGNNQFLQNSGGYGGQVSLDLAFKPEFIAGCQVTIVATVPPGAYSPGNDYVATGLTALIILAGTLTQPPPVFGCTDPSATNYNPGAVVNDGSCLYPVGGGSGGGTTPVPGCTNPAAINYNPAATVDNGTCILPVRGCTIAGSLNYNPSANVNDGSCIPIMRGCTVPGATNYSASANKDDGSCVFPLAAAPAAPAPSCCVWGGDLLLVSTWAGSLLPGCAWSTADYCPAPGMTVTPPAPAAAPASYGTGNDPFGLGNDPMGGGPITSDTSTPVSSASGLAGLGNDPFSIGNDPLGGGPVTPDTSASVAPLTYYGLGNEPVVVIP